MIKEYAKEFTMLLESKNNRLQWGGMTALNTIASEFPESVYPLLSKIIKAADLGSVITKDQAVSILIKLSSIKKYSEKTFQLLIEELKFCPTNQLPMYAENALTIINTKNKQLFIKTLTSRIDEIEKDAKRTRVEKIIRKAGAI